MCVLCVRCVCMCCVCALCVLPVCGRCVRWLCALCVRVCVRAVRVCTDVDAENVGQNLLRALRKIALWELFWRLLALRVSVPMARRRRR